MTDRLAERKRLAVAMGWTPYRSNPEYWVPPNAQKMGLGGHPRPVPDPFMNWNDWGALFNWFAEQGSGFKGCIEYIGRHHSGDFSCVILFDRVRHRGVGTSLEAFPNAVLAGLAEPTREIGSDI